MASCFMLLEYLDLNFVCLLSLSVYISILRIFVNIGLYGNCVLEQFIVLW